MIKYIYFMEIICGLVAGIGKMDTKTIVKGDQNEYWIIH